MFTYSQATGELFQDGKLIGTGYSGRNIPDGPQGRNNPGLESVRDVGPIPRGLYTIDDPVSVPNHAFPVFALIPHGQPPYGRTGFLIHGNNVQNDASRGCIILDFPARTAVEEALQNDRELEVIE